MNIVLTKINRYSKEDIDAGVDKSLDSLGCGDNLQCDSVVIKPNLCYYWEYSTGQTTDPRVVSSIVDWVRQKAGKDVEIYIAEADASAMRTKYSFRMLGFEKLAEEKHVNLVNLSEGEVVEKEVVVAGNKLALRVNSLLLDSDLLINVPKLKTHRAVGFTCSLKNIFGTIAAPRKFTYHKKLAETIVGINKIVKTDIVLVDGIIAGGKTPKRMGVIIAGTDTLAVDTVAARAIGYNPSKIGYLELARKERIGETESINLLANPVTTEDIRKEFPAPNYRMQKIMWRLELGLLSAYAWLTGDVIPPILEE